MLIVVILGVVLLLVGAVFLLGGQAEAARLSTLPLLGPVPFRPGQGPMRVLGTAATANPLVGPVSGKPCALFKLTLEYQDTVYDHDNGARRARFTTSTLRYAEDFVIEGEAGAVPVNPQGARLHVQASSVVRPGFLPPQHVEKLIRDMLPPKQQNLVQSLREERVEVGEPLLGIGPLEKAPAGLLLTGSHQLELWAGGEKAFARAHARGNRMGLLILLAGALLLAVGGVWAGSEYFSEEEEEALYGAAP